MKTTQPSWYYVRPNQQVVDVGKTEEVVIVLVDAECTRFLESAARGVPEKLDKHRFLVQTKTLEDAEYEAIVALQPGQRTEGVRANVCVCVCVHAYVHMSREKVWPHSCCLLPSCWPCPSIVC